MANLNPSYIHILVGVPTKLHESLKRELRRFKNSRKTFLLLETTDAEECYSVFRSYLSDLENSSDGSLPENLIGISVLSFIGKAKEYEIIRRKFQRETRIVCLKHPVEWYKIKRPKDLNLAAKSLYKTLKKTVDGLEKQLRVLKDEIHERKTKTPLLLPFDNFDETGLELLCSEIQSIPLDEDCKRSLSKIVSNFEKSFPKKRIPKHILKNIPKSKWHAQETKIERFCNPNSLYFRTPGSFEEHGKARSALGDHFPNCWPRSVLRFGVPYSNGFHYDCVAKNLKKDWTSCHNQLFRTSKTYLNIAPNDNIRK